MDDKPPEHQSLARILMDKGLLSQSQVTGILEYQCRLPPGQYMSFTDIVLEFEYMTEEQLVEIMGNQYYVSKDPISQILVEQGLVSPDQLTQALAVLESFSREHVAEVLVDLGFATKQGIEQAISQHQIQQSESLKSLHSKEDSGLKSRLAQAFSHVKREALTSPPLVETPAPEQAEAADAPEAEAPAYFSTRLEIGQSLTAEVPQVGTQQAEDRVHLPLGRKLIAAGHLTESELQDALDYQERLPHVMHKPLGEILVEMGYISEALLQELLAEEKVRELNQRFARPRIGDVLMQAGIIQEWQLAHALRLQFTPAHASQKLGEILVAMGYTTREKIEAALATYYQEDTPAPAPASAPLPVETSPAVPVVSPPMHRPLGQLLLEREYISQEQLDAALLVQKELADEYTPLGDILVMQGHLTEAQLQEVLSAQGRFQRRPLGQVLVDMQVLEEWQLSYALCVQHSAPPEKRILLGDVLLAMEYVTEEQLQAALLEQQR